jgi:type I restriction enzyme S subunit
VGDDALAEIFSMSAPVLVSQFDLLAGAPGGVARLRELILSLAVRGKLTAQHPTDEPAHVLLQRIQDAKALHVPRGGRRAAGTAMEVNESDLEVLDSLPPGWVWSSLSSIGLISPRNEAEDAAIASFVPMSAIPVAFTDAHETESRPWLDIKSGFTHFAEGDVGVAKITPCFENGKSTVFKDLCNGIGAGTTELYVVRPLCGVTPRYVLLFLKSPGFLKGGEAVMTGTAGQKRLPRAFFEDCPFPLPPLAEQARIVARVDELMQLCDALEAKGRLEAQQHARLLETLLVTLTDSTTPEELAANWQRVAEHFDLLLDRPEAVDVLEQTVLQLAVRGLLVPQDRNDIPPARLISTGPGRSPVPPHSTIPPDQSESNVETGLLPSGWELVQLHQVADTRLGKMLDKSKNRGLPRPYLRNTNVQWGRFDLGDVKTMNLEESELQEFRLAVGDLLICEGGEPGRCAIWRDDEREMYFQKALHRVRPHAGVSAEYIAIALESDAISGALDEYFTGATIKHFVGQALQRYTFALPPAAEQARIVARVTELRRLCAELRHCLAASQATQSRLAGALVESVETT